MQPYDKENKTLAVPQFWEGYWTDFDWQKAITAGMQQVGVPYSGAYDFVETRMYSSVHHGIVPANKALGCADCHRGEAVNCRRCHQKAQGMDLPAHSLTLYPDVKSRMDFKALGYEDDPAQSGGRLNISLGRGAPR